MQAETASVSPQCFPAHILPSVTMSVSFITADCQSAHLQILYTVAALNVADVLGQEGPQTAHQLAETLGMQSIILRAASMDNLV